MIQALRYGFAQEYTWDEAIIFQGDDLQEAERYLLVIFPNMDPKYLEGATAAFRATPYKADMVIQGQTHLGTWELIHMKPEKQEDGSIWVKCFFGVPRYTLTAFDNINTPKETDIIYCWNVPKRLAQALVTSYRTGTGTGCIANYATPQGLVDLTIRQKTAAAIITFSNIKTESGCLIIEYDDFYWGLTKAQAEVFDIGSAPAGWNYKLLSLSYSADGYYEAHVRRTQTVTKTVFPSGLRIEDSADSYVTRVGYLNSAAAPASVSAGVGERKFIRNPRLNGYCQYDYDVDTETVKEQTSDSWDNCTGYTEHTAHTRHGTVKTEPTAEAGKLQVTHNLPDGYGKYNSDVMVRTIKDISGGRIRRVGWDQIVTGTHIIGAAAIPADPATYGEVNVHPGNDGRYYGIKTDTEYFNSSAQANWDEWSQTGLTGQTIQYCTIGGIRKKRTKTITYNLLFCRNSVEAYVGPSGVNGGLDGSRVDFCANSNGPYGYRVIKVTNIAHGAWSNDV